MTVLPPALHAVCGTRSGGDQSALSHRALLFAGYGGDFRGTKGPLQCKRCKRLGHTQRNCGYAPRCVPCGVSHLSGDCPAPRGQPRCSSCEGNHMANNRGCVRWKGARAALAKRTPERGRKMVASNKPAVAPKGNRAEPSAEQMDLGEGWSHVVRGGLIAKASAPKPISQPVTGAPTQPQVTATKKAAKPEKA